MGLTMIGGFTQGTAFSYLASSSFVFIDLHHLSPTGYSLVFGANAVGLIGASQITSQMMRRIGAERLVLLAMAGSAIGAAVLLGAALAGHDTLALTIACLFVLFASMGLVMGPASVLALDPHPGLAGTASALMGILQFASGAVSSAVVSALFDGTALPMAAVMAACNGAAFLLAWHTCGPGRFPARA
jgi:DHA1 family bicyclomycin/chloramphenicol resistance-like MFS transporter